MKEHDSAYWRPYDRKQLKITAGVLTATAALFVGCAMLGWRMVNKALSSIY